MLQIACFLFRKNVLSDKFVKNSEIICVKYQLKLEKFVDIMLTRLRSRELVRVYFNQILLILGGRKQWEK